MRSSRKKLLRQQQRMTSLRRIRYFCTNQQNPHSQQLPVHEFIPLLDLMLTQQNKKD